MSELIQKKHVVIKFAGDSGDGMQLAGNQFTNNTALAGNDIATFPDFPAEIRAPAGTLAGVSGFQIHFSSQEIHTPGDAYDVLVAMNAAAFRKNIKYLRAGGNLILNTSGFNSKNLKLAGYQEEENPLESDLLQAYQVYPLDITKLTREHLSDIEISDKERDRSRNMFVLGFVLWMYGRSLDNTVRVIEQLFEKKPIVQQTNIKSLKSGYFFGDTTETFTSRYEVAPAKLSPGRYRNIKGNQAIALALIAAAEKSSLPLFYGSYPITPASDVLHELAKHKNFGVKTFQAEDEIAAACAAVGASFGGNLGVCGTSGPGMALKSEALGLATILELPLVVCDVQRAGPSTGMPTKTEQSDLLLGMYGRNGEAPLPILAASSPSDCFDTALEACRIAVEHMTPVILLSDGYIANGSEPWKTPEVESIPVIKPNYATSQELDYQPYQRDERLVRSWAIPGMANTEHQVGGLEKEDISGAVSYDPENHEKMVKLRAEKIMKVADSLPEQQIVFGPESGKLLVIGWGSTYGAITSAVRELNSNSYAVSHLHLRYLNPLPKNLESILSSFEQILVPELNNGQLSLLLKQRLSNNIIPMNKIQGIPFTKEELKQRIESIIQNT